MDEDMVGASDINISKLGIGSYMKTSLYYAGILDDRDMAFRGEFVRKVKWLVLYLCLFWCLWLTLIFGLFFFFFFGWLPTWVNETSE